MPDYEIQYKKVKYVTLRITADGLLRVTAPYGTTDACIGQILQQKASWISRQQQKITQLQQQRAQQGLYNRYKAEGQIAYLGRQYPLQLLSGRKRCWHWDGSVLQIQGCMDEAQCKTQVEAFYRQQLLETILPVQNELVRQRLSALSLPQPIFAVRKMRASWGLCYSKQHKIILNLWLAMAPEDCIRQVLIHEYLHFCQNNHSAEFYALLEHFEPQYRQLKQKLSVLVDLTAISR